MTDTRKYVVGGAMMTVTTVVYQSAIEIAMTLDTRALDSSEPDHSAHDIIDYADAYLTNWTRPESLWWIQRKRYVVCKTGSQAQRIVRNAISRVDDALSAAILDRDRRKAEMAVAVAV